MSTKNALDLVKVEASEDDNVLLDLGKRIGIALTSGMLRRQCGWAEAQALKWIKESGFYKKFGPWEDFCPAHLGAPERTVDRIIAEAKQYGEELFALRRFARISPDVYSQLQIADGKLVIDDEEVAITKTNEAKIKAHIQQVQQDLAKEREAHGRTKGVLTKTAEEKSEAKRAAEKAREELLTLKSAERNQVAGSDDEEHSAIINLHSAYAECHGRLAGLMGKQMTDINNARLIGMIEWQRRELAQISQIVAETKGLGENSAFPVAEEFINDLHPGARNVLIEHVQEMRKRK
jgi:hypothetical protein